MKIRNDVPIAVGNNVSPAPEQPEVPSVIVTKGSRHRHEEIANLKADLNLLKDYARTKIKDLPEDVRIKFNHLRNSFVLLEDTELYEQVYNLAQDVFNCKTVQPADLQPGIVLTAICGCLENSRNSCSLYCAEAMKRPKSQGGQTCQDNVFVANNSGQVLELEHITVSTNSHRAIIYVQYTRPENFPGFNLSELHLLRSKNIESVKLAGFPNRNQDSFMSPNFVSLDDLPKRSEPQINNSGDDQLMDGSGITLAVFVIIIILIIAIIYLLYTYGRDQSR